MHLSAAVLCLHKSRSCSCCVCACSTCVAVVLVWLPMQGLIRFLDILLFVEATIYQMDEENEALCEMLAANPQDPTHAGNSCNTQHTFAGTCHDASDTTFTSAFASPPISTGTWHCVRWQPQGSAQPHPLPRPAALLASCACCLPRCCVDEGVLLEVLQQQQLLSERVQAELQGVSAACYSVSVLSAANGVCASSAVTAVKVVSVLCQCCRCRPCIH